MGRTNKMGILKKKQQQAKQKKKMVEPKKKRSNEGMRRSYTNPKGNEYEWFMRSGKWICDKTTAREDPDGYRIRRKPGGGDPEFVFYGEKSRGYRRRKKKQMKMKRK